MVNFVFISKERLEQHKADWEADRMGQISGETEASRCRSARVVLAGALTRSGRITARAPSILARRFFYLTLMTTLPFARPVVR
jgi:hypothetical protein